MLIGSCDGAGPAQPPGLCRARATTLCTVGRRYLSRYLGIRYLVQLRPFYAENVWRNVPNYLSMYLLRYALHDFKVHDLGVCLNHRIGIK